MVDPGWIHSTTLLCQRRHTDLTFGGSKKALTGAGVIGMVRGGSGGGSMVDPGWIHIEKGGSGFYECYK